MKYLIGLILVVASLALAGPGPAGNIVQFAKDGVPTNVSQSGNSTITSNPLPVTLVNGLSIGVIGQGVAGSSSWLFNLNQVGSSAIKLGSSTGGGSIPVVIASDQSPIPVTGSFSITGGATSANQLLELNYLSAIQSNTGLSTVNSSGLAACSTVSTVSSLSPPLGATGFVLMSMDTSTSNIRWAVGSAATTAIGQQLQPGRSSDFVSVNSSVSIIAESGTQNYCIQWVIK